MKKHPARAAFGVFLLLVFTTSAYPQWTQTNGPAGNSLFRLSTGRDMVLARTWDSVNGGRTFVTRDNGASWNQARSPEGELDILSVVALNDSTLAGTWNGFYRATAGDPNWHAVAPTGIPADTAVYSLAVIDNTLLAGTTGAIYRSSNDGSTWTWPSVGIPTNARITSLVASRNIGLAGTDSAGVFGHYESGLIWEEANEGLGDKHISQLVATGGKLFAVTSKGVFVADANAMSWAADASGLKKVNCLLAVKNGLLAGTDSNGVYLSTDSGLTWAPFSSGMPAATRVWSLAASSDDSFVFAGTGSGIWRAPLPAAFTKVEN